MPRRTVLEEGVGIRVHAPTPGDGDELLALARRSRRLHRGWMSTRLDADARAADLERTRGNGTRASCCGGARTTRWRAS